jgi:hypothetical protein
LVGAEHEAVAPPLLPAQYQLQGPLPMAVDAVPALQRLAAGAALAATPFALPHVPLISFRAEQLAVVPPPDPAHVQVHGPEPLTLEAAPTLQRFAVGVLVRSDPLEEPHAPFTDCPFTEARAEQVAVVPPLLPTQLQFQGPLPAIVDAEPALQRLLVGALARRAPFEEPHAPLILYTVEQLAVVPSREPAHVQFHGPGPGPFTLEAVPALQRFAVGLLVKSAPFEEPHAPLTPPPGADFAEPRNIRTQLAAIMDP